MTNETQQFTLRKGDETRIVRTADEARNAFLNGFFPLTYESELDIRKSFGVTIPEEKEPSLQMVEEGASKNRGRELIYLSSGLDNWFEEVNNYWHNRNHREFLSNQSILTGLNKQILGHISDGIATILHQDPKDVGAYGLGLQRFNEQVLKNSNIPRGFCSDVKAFLENVRHELVYKNSAGMHWKDGKLPDRLQPKDASVKESHPLIVPFRGTLEQLKSQGIAELPDWLVAQGRMAGVSAVYQNIPLQLKGWMQEAVKLRDAYNDYVKRNGIQNAPRVILPTHYADQLSIVDNHIHRRTI